MCSIANLIQFCGSQSMVESTTSFALNSTDHCRPQSCPYEYSPVSPVPCFCAAPLLIGYRLKSPGFSRFPPYKSDFEEYLTMGLRLFLYQLYIDSVVWQEGPRLRMYLKLYPVYDPGSDNANTFNESEVKRIRRMFTDWRIPDNDIFGPYELLNFTLLSVYQNGKYHFFHYVFIQIEIQNLVHRNFTYKLVPFLLIYSVFLQSITHYSFLSM